MKITLNIYDELLADAVKLNIEEEISIQRYIRAAITYFNYMREAELKGSKCGYSHPSGADRFILYNTEYSPGKELKNS